MVMIFLNQNLPYSSCWTWAWFFWWGKRPQSFWFWYIGDQPLTSPFSLFTSRQAVRIKPTTREIRECH